MISKTPVLMTAATRWEAEPLARALGLPPSGEARWEGLSCGRRILLLKTGVGEVKTRTALDCDCVAADYGLAISAGLCGAMQENVRSLDIVADVQDIPEDHVSPLREAARALGLPLHFGTILHTNIVLKPEIKRRLGAEHRAAACDMETAAVRRWAFGKIPVLGLRAVLDEIDEDLPEDVPGEETPAALAQFALSHASQLPLLVKTGWRSARAMKALSRLLKAYLEAL